MLTHKPATDKLIEDFLADVLQPYIDKGKKTYFVCCKLYFHEAWCK